MNLPLLEQLEIAKGIGYKGPLSLAVYSVNLKEVLISLKGAVSVQLSNDLDLFSCFSESISFASSNFIKKMSLYVKSIEASFPESAFYLTK